MGHLMSKYIEVTHKYVLEVPPGTSDNDIRQGIGIMEHFMRDRSKRMIELKSSFQVMPREYAATLVPQDPGQVNLEDRAFPDAGGVTHPWDQGLFIFPEDHPLASIERRLKEQYDEPGHRYGSKEVIKQSTLELEAGDDDEI